MVSNFEETFEQTSMSPEIVFKVGSYENVINYLIDWGGLFYSLISNEIISQEKLQKNMKLFNYSAIILSLKKWYTKCKKSKQNKFDGSNALQYFYFYLTEKIITYLR